MTEAKSGQDHGRYASSVSRRISLGVLPKTFQDVMQVVWNHHTMGIIYIVFSRRDDNPEEADVTLYPNFGSWVKVVERPVPRRGWCFQERELSPRVLHFALDRIGW